MKIQLIKSLPALALFALSAIQASPAMAGDSACYEWSAFPTERFRLDVKYHSSLSENDEVDFGNARQKTFSVHGKNVGGCGYDSMGTATGTVVTGSSTGSTSGPTGAHLGLSVSYTRGFNGNEICRNLEVECTSAEDDSTPYRWYCFSRNEFNVFHGFSVLTRVNPKYDSRCGVFQDGANGGLASDASGPGSAMKR